MALKPTPPTDKLQRAKQAVSNTTPGDLALHAIRTGKSTDPHDTQEREALNDTAYRTWVRDAGHHLPNARDRLSFYRDTQLTPARRIIDPIALGLTGGIINIAKSIYGAQSLVTGRPVNPRVVGTMDQMQQQLATTGALHEHLPGSTAAVNLATRTAPLMAITAAAPPVGAAIGAATSAGETSATIQARGQKSGLTPRAALSASVAPAVAVGATDAALGMVIPKAIKSTVSNAIIHQGVPLARGIIQNSPRAPMANAIAQAVTPIVSPLVETPLVDKAQDLASNSGLKPTPPIAAR